MDNFHPFEKLVNISTLPSLQNVVKILSEDLLSIDTTIIYDKLEELENIVFKDFTGDSIQKIIEDKDFVNVENILLHETAVLCRDKIYSHPEWCLLSGRIKMLSLKRTTPKTFVASVILRKEMLDKKYYDFCVKHHEKLETLIDRTRDWKFDIFAISTLIKGYLGKISVKEETLIDENENDEVETAISIEEKEDKTLLAETPQYMYLRMATFLWFDNDNTEKGINKSIERIKVAYDDFSQGTISGPSPLMFNAGLVKSQMASCFMMVEEDDMVNISECWRQQAIISKHNGGLGICFDALRHSSIGKGGGWSKGLVPWIKVSNEILCTVDQGGQRKGSGTAYTTCWNTDIFEFIDLKDPVGKPEVRAIDMFYCIMISDLFMRRVRDNKLWTLICPAIADGLHLLYGKKFEEKYAILEKKYRKHKSSKIVKARELWLHILNSQIKVGMPFIVYKDSINRKTNHEHLGTIRLSNLCLEICEYVDSENISSCNLSSIPLSPLVKLDCDGKPQFDFIQLGNITRRTMRNLMQIINRNYYPPSIPQIKNTNLRNRPIGIGCQDLAGCFALMDICWDSEEAKELNKKIARTMYYHGMHENIELAKKYGKYDTFPGSPTSKGLFQFDMWEMERIEKVCPFDISRDKLIEMAKSLRIKDEYDFELLEKDMVEYGLYFSLLFAQMPTASSAHILGNNESREPYTQLMCARTVLSGQFLLTVKHLVKDLEKIGLWTDNMLKNIITNQGSIQNYPEDNLSLEVKDRLIYLKKKYLTSFELSQKVIANLCIDFAEYQCQSSSHNVFMKQPTATSLSAYHFYVWGKGIKTGLYYLHSKPGSNPLNFSIDSIKVSKRKIEYDGINVNENLGKIVNLDGECTINCLSCHS